MLPHTPKLKIFTGVDISSEDEIDLQVLANQYEIANVEMASTNEDKGPQLPSKFEAYLAYYERLSTDDLIKFVGE